MSKRIKMVSLVVIGGSIVLLGSYVGFQAFAKDIKREKKAVDIPKSIETEDKDKKLYDDAMKLYNQEDYKNAYQKFQEIVEKYPDSEYCLIALGMIQRYYLEGISGPQEESRKSLSLEEETPHKLMIKAQVKYITARSMADVEEAVQIWRKIMDKYPNSKLVDDAQLKIAKFYYDKRDYEQAIKECQKIIDKYPDSNSAPAADIWIAYCYGFLKNYSMAIEKCKEVINKYPNNIYAPLAQRYIASTYEDLRDYQQAIIEYQKVIDTYPNYEGIPGVKYCIERCQLLLELQKKGVNVAEYQSESPETLRKILEKYSK